MIGSFFIGLALLDDWLQEFWASFGWFGQTIFKVALVCIALWAIGRGMDALGRWIDGTRAESTHPLDEPPLHANCRAVIEAEAVLAACQASYKPEDRGDA